MLLRLLLLIVQLLSPALEKPQPQNVTRLVPSCVVHRPSLVSRGLHHVLQVPPFPGVLTLVSEFWFLLCPGSLYPLDGWGNSCPLCGPRSGTRNSRRSRAGNGSRSCLRSRTRTGPRACARSCIRACTCSGFCNCAFNCIRPWHRSGHRSRGRNSLRTRARSGPLGGDRNGRRNGAQNSIRSSLCSGPTISPRSGLCPAVSGTCLRSEDNRGRLAPAPLLLAATC
jgi:hypothetical protein